MICPRQNTPYKAARIPYQRSILYDCRISHSLFFISLYFIEKSFSEPSISIFCHWQTQTAWFVHFLPSMVHQMPNLPAPRDSLNKKSPAKESSILCRGILTLSNISFIQHQSYIIRPSRCAGLSNQPTSATRNPLDSSMSLHSPSRCIQYTLFLSCCGTVSSSTPT